MMKNYIIILIVLIMMLLLPSCIQNKKPDEFWVESKSPKLIGNKVVIDLLNRQPFMMYETEHATSVHYAEACAGYGAARFAGINSDSLLLGKIFERYLRVIDDSIENTANHVDANVYGILPLELFMQTGDYRFKIQGLELADGQNSSVLDNGLTSQVRYWIDDLYMIVALQVQAYRVTKEPLYLDKAAALAYEYLKKLQQPNGLFHHGPGAPVYWGRGNGWVAAGLAELLTELPVSHKLYYEIVIRYKLMMESLLKYQANDGMWRQLIDNEGSWKESSCTAMFGFAIHTGIKKGILTGIEFTQSYRKAWNAVTNYVGEDGKLREVCVGTGKSADFNYYLERPRITGDFHGQAPLLWFACSLLEQAN